MQSLGCKMVSKDIDPRHHIGDANYTTSNRHLRLSEGPLCIRMFGTILPNPELRKRHLDQADSRRLGADQMRVMPCGRVDASELSDGQVLCLLLTYI